jgi:hypothetical protein
MVLVGACGPAPVVPSVSPSTATPTTATPTSTPSDEPVESPSASLAPVAEILPVEGTALPIAARDGAPGLISCGGIGPFAIERLRGPGGAEDFVGPEYDVLRDTIARYEDDPEFATFKDATFTVVLRDSTKVEFLGKIGQPESVYASISASFDGVEWSWAGMDGACIPVGAPGPGWYDVIWTANPAFAKPTPRTRRLHLLVSEIECSADVPVAGRLSPAWVFLERARVRIHLLIRPVEPFGSCDGIEPTPVTLTLPEPLGARRLKDAVDHDICRGCGG